MQGLPNFFIVGAPKSGTTSLYHYLDQHPQIYMSPIKEPCFFASEIRPENMSPEHRRRIAREMRTLEKYLAGPMLEKRFGGMVSDWDSYLKLFQNVATEKAIGEASVCYLWSPTAPANITARIPNAKIIMILRDPVDRAFSQYLHTVTSGLVRTSFREEVKHGLRPHNGKFGLRHPFLEFGLYHQQVKRYLESFPRENVRIYWYEDDRARTMADILQFLEVQADSGSSQRYLEPRVPRAIAASYFLKKFGMWERAKKLSPDALQLTLRKLVLKPRKALAIDPKDRKYLLDYYREDIEQLAGLLNRDLTSWLQ